MVYEINEKIISIDLDNSYTDIYRNNKTWLKWNTIIYNPWITSNIEIKLLSHNFYAKFQDKLYPANMKKGKYHFLCKDYFCYILDMSLSVI